MSVVTTADEKLQDARSHLNDAMDALHELTVRQVWGWDDFTPEYRKRLDCAYSLVYEALKAMRTN